MQNSGKNNEKDPKRQTLHSLKTNIGIPVGIHIRYCICSQNHDPAPSFNLSNNLQDFWFSSSSSFAKLQSFSSFWHCAKRIKGGCWFYSWVADTIGTVQSHLEPIGSVYMCIPPCVLGKTCIVLYGDVVSFSGKYTPYLPLGGRIRTLRWSERAISKDMCTNENKIGDVSIARPIMTSKLFMRS